MPPNNSTYTQPQPPEVPQPGLNPQGYPAMPPAPGVPQMPNMAQMPPQQMPAQPMQAAQQPFQPPVNAGAPIGSGPGDPSNQSSKPTPKNPNSTQSTLQLSEIRDSMVIMIDGSYRTVVACKSINFDLMSDREREGVEYSYQNFLNSLNFPIQILIRSQKVDIEPYIGKLEDIRRSQDNMLLGVLMDDYINFIDALADEANIMEKTFYITIPYFPQGDAANLVEQGKGFFGKLFARSQNTITRIDSVAYQKAKDEMKNRVDSVTAGLFQLGVQSAQLDTKSLSELYYNYYNPDTAVRQPIGNFDNVASTYVRRAAPQSPQPPVGGVQ